MSLKVLALLTVSLSLVLTEENDFSLGARAVQRRYSEAILASDYSRTMDNMLKKNFVEWLLARREKKSDNAIDPSKREAEPQLSAVSGQGLELASQGAQDFFVWLLKNKRKQRVCHVRKGVKSLTFLSLLVSRNAPQPLRCPLHSAFLTEAFILHKRTRLLRPKYPLI
uniref:Gastric inhibitory polypeptide n=1 Tax=Gopherus evgoodei TaxID=1825980 RepID=A0A8C4YIA9_9SAUR